MLTLIIITFACTILLGATLISFVMRDKPTPKPVAFFHGSFATISIVLLIIYNFMNLSPLVLVTVIFITGAVGGAFLLYRDITRKKIPKGVAILHAAIGIIAFVLLLIFSMVYH